MMSPVSRFQLRSMSVELRRVAVDEIIALRHEVLRPGLPRESAEYAVDSATGTVHFGSMPRLLATRRPQRLSRLRSPLSAKLEHRTQ